MSSWVIMAVGLLTMGADAVEVASTAAYIWCSTIGRRWVCPRSSGTSKEEELKHLLETALLAVFTGAVVLGRAKSNRLGVFLEVFKDRQRVMEVNWSSVDK